MKLLLIGNSHTYYNSMPETLARLFAATGQKTHVTMLAEGGRDLAAHVNLPATAFNIRCGQYDAVIAQERVSGFTAATLTGGARTLLDMAQRAGSQFFLYMPFVPKDARELQRAMTETYHTFCRANNCLFAPVGEVFTRLLSAEPPEALYREDGKHATPLGSYVAAVTLFYTVSGRKRILNISEIEDPGVKAGFPAELCQKIHTESCHMTRLYNG